MPKKPVERFGEDGRQWNVSHADVARQAIAPLRGYVYQLHQSASAWIHLKEGELLHLEVAEDFAQILREPGRLDSILMATQVKDTRESGCVTLNSPDVLAAIEALFRLKRVNPGREVRLTFLTTSEIGVERKHPLPSGVPGLRAWRDVAAGGNASEIRGALLERFEPGELGSWIRGCSDEELRTQLLSALSFVCGAGSWEQIELSNRDALRALHRQVQSTPDMAERAYDAVFGYLITTILSSATRSLDRDQLIALLKRATSIAVPSEIVNELLGELASSRTDTPIDRAQLREVAQLLLDTGTPPSILMLFPEATPTTRAALSAAMGSDRTVIETHPISGAPARVGLAELLAMPERKHLVIGAAGSGKSHTFWHCAQRLLNAGEGEYIPFFLPVGQLNRWSEVLAMVREVAPKHSPENLLADERVCVFLDGWSEFATGEHTFEKQTALRALRPVRVLANAKFAEVSDIAFKGWSLELLSLEQVTGIRERAYPGSPALSAAVLDLLRLPLLLSLHLLSGANAPAPGELLRQFHTQLARTLPEGFTEILAGAVATVSLKNDRSYGRLVAELNIRARSRGITEPTRLLQRLGTIVERNGLALPVHDLYWSWLAGWGLVGERLAVEALTPLHTRESFALALESGASPDATDIDHTLKDDLVLSASLEAGRRASSLHPGFVEALERALRDRRLAVRSRGGLAALVLGKPEYLRRALAVLSDVSQTELSVEQWRQGLHPARLYAQRATLAAWLGSPGSDLLLDSIAEHGGPEWVPWLEQMVLSGKVSANEALAAALACDPNIPAWGMGHLDGLLNAMTPELQAVIKRRANRPLAHYIAANYARLTEESVDDDLIVQFRLNPLLVSCGDDAAFEVLLKGFTSAAPSTQALMADAVVDRGPPWIQAFQKVAFAAPRTDTEPVFSAQRVLSEVTPSDIDDATAREWIAAGHEEIGWRALIAHHDAALIPELIAQLPPSFANLDHSPALLHLGFVKQAPRSLIPELLGRLGSPMRPELIDELLCALATVYPDGMTSIFELICRQPDAFSLHDIACALRLYRQWRERAGAPLMLHDLAGEPLPVDELIVIHCAIERWDDRVIPAMLSWLPDLAIYFVLGPFRNNDKKGAAVLYSLRGVRSYHAELLAYMLSRPKLAQMVPQVFAYCFDTFPVEALHRCLASPQIRPEPLLIRLMTSSNPLHLSVHRLLIERILRQPMNLYNYRALANMLRSHTRHDVIDLLRSTLSLAQDHAVWFVREAETARGELLIDEKLHFRT